MKVNNVPYACGSVTKSKCIAKAFAEMKTSEPISVLRACSSWTSWGLNKLTARCSSVAHSPLRLCIANSAGTQPSGPVPVTRTLRAPNSYRCCINHAFISFLQHKFWTLFYNYLDKDSMILIFFFFLLSSFTWYHFDYWLTY